MDQIGRIKEIVEPLVHMEDLILYDVSWHSEGSMRILQIAIMKKDGSMDIDTCATMSEKISTKLDEDDFISSEYFLEVCSPGAERELKDEAQIKEAVNAFVYVKLKDPKSGLADVKGTLRDLQDGILYIDYMDKAVKRKIEIAMSNVLLIRLSVKI